MFFKKSSFVFLLLIHSTVYSQELRIVSLIKEQQNLYPKMDVEDVYKLLYQGTLGVEHILSDTLEAKQYLSDEMTSIDSVAFSSESLIENISLDSAIVRVNLRPFKQARMKSALLWRAMVNSVHQFSPKQDDFIQTWQAFKRLVKEKKLSFNENDLKIFDVKAQAAHYRPFHHSVKYTKKYRPAYRVVLKSEFEKWRNDPSKN